jgi:periplasmic mercuric ion binding protein
MLKKAIFGSIIFIITFIFAFGLQAQAQGQNTEEVQIKVLGNCGMCKERIEKAAYSVRGVRSANWNIKEQKLTLVYRTDRTDQQTIERAIARAGHDTENFLTDEKTHANLHHCCVYKRDPEYLRTNTVYNEE